MAPRLSAFWNCITEQMQGMLKKCSMLDAEQGKGMPISHPRLLKIDCEEIICSIYKLGQLS